MHQLFFRRRSAVALLAATALVVDGCVASPDTVPAGAVTFVVTNVDSLAVTEVELVADQRIVGERENLAPGFDSTFSARLDGGTYQLYCPGASTERRPFTVTGQATAQLRRQHFLHLPGIPFRQCFADAKDRLE